MNIEAKIIGAHLVIELREGDDQGDFLVASTELPLVDLAAALEKAKVKD
jgi:hypothetical protein